MRKNNSDLKNQKRSVLSVVRLLLPILFLSGVSVFSHTATAVSYCRYDKETKSYIVGSSSANYWKAKEFIARNQRKLCYRYSDGTRICGLSSGERRSIRSKWRRRKCRRPRILQYGKKPVCGETESGFWVCGGSQQEQKSLAQSIEGKMKDQNKPVYQVANEKCFKHGAKVICADSRALRFKAAKEISKGSYQKVLENKPSQKVTPKQVQKEKSQIAQSKLNGAGCDTVLEANSGKNNLYRFCGVNKEQLKSQFENGNIKCKLYRSGLHYCGSEKDRLGQYGQDPLGAAKCGKKRKRLCQKNEVVRSVFKNAGKSSPDRLFLKGSRKPIEISGGKGEIEKMVNSVEGVESDGSGTVLSAEEKKGSVDCRKAQTSDKKCMICSCSHEAGVQSFKGKRLVLNTKINRFFHYYKPKVRPKNLCDVVYHSRKRNAAQFSWINNNERRKVVKGKEYQDCLKAYKETVASKNLAKILKNPKGASHYYANYVKPRWARKCKFRARDQRGKSGAYHTFCYIPGERSPDLKFRGNRIALEYARKRKGKSLLAKMRDSVFNGVSTVFEFFETHAVKLEKGLGIK